MNILAVVLPFIHLAGFAAPPPVAANAIFSLGPYREALPPGPVELPFAGFEEPTGTLAAVELDGSDREIAVYPGALLDAPERPGIRLASFAPFPLPNGETEWAAGSVRRFRFQPATEKQAAAFPELVCKSFAEELVVGNSWYTFSLAPVDAPLTGSARRIVRKITFANGREFVPSQTVSDLTGRIGAETVIHAWHFDPDTPPQLRRHGLGMATVSYGGGYEGVDVTWRVTFTFYADLPLVKIRFERRRLGDNPFAFGRSMQVFFNPKSPEWPVKRRHVTQHRDDWVSLAIANEPAAQIAFLLPDNRTSGLAHWATTWGYLCASWEAGGYRPFRNGDEDSREFYLLLTGKPNPGEALDRRVRALKSMREMGWHVSLRALFDHENRK